MSGPYFGVPQYPSGPPAPPDTRRWITLALLVTVLGFGVGVGFAFAGRSDDDDDRVSTARDTAETTRTEPATTTTLPPTTIPERLEFTLVHRMSPSICEVQVSSTDDADWGPNRLQEDDRFETDDVRSFDAPYGDLLDLRATSCDGTETWSRRAVELDPDEQLVLNQNWSHTVIQTTTTGTTRPPATTSPPRTTPSTRTPATTSPPRTVPATTTPPSTEPPCGYAEAPQDVRAFVDTTSEDGVSYTGFRVAFTSCSPGSDYELVVADTDVRRFASWRYTPTFGDGTATFGWNGDEKFSRFRFKASFLRESIRTASICARIVSSDGEKSWGQYCSTWTNPNPPSWDGQRYTVYLENDGSPTACYIRISSIYDEDWGDELLGATDFLRPGGWWSFTVPGGPTKLRAQDCDHNTIWQRGNELIDSDRTYTFTGGLSYP